MNKRTTTAIAGSALIALALTACSTKAADNTGSSGGGSGDLKTDIGVTDTEISLAVQTDSSSVFKVLGLGLTAGNQLWANDVNAAGGICKRQIKLDIQDNGYKADTALPIYEQQKTSNLGYIQLLGSPILAALKQNIIDDQMVSVTASWASENLDAPEVLMLGQTYDIEMINGLSWLQGQGKIADGDKIGHIYIDSEYGKNALLGSQAYAKEHGQEIVAVPVSGTDTDMTATMTKFKQDGVKAVLLTVAPGATASVVVQNTDLGMNLPIVGSNPTFSPTLLTDQGVVAALSNFYLVTSVAPYSQDAAFAKQLATKYEAAYTDEPNQGINAGYIAGLAWESILNKACSDGDLTRAGILAAKAKVTSVDTKGMMGSLDFSQEGAPTSRQAFVEQADTTAKGGLKITAELFESPEATNYKAPFQK